MQPYQPIENYGVIGDLNTIALVGLDGSIDFLCMPDFDSPTVFASLLDKDRGGYFKITAQHDNIKYKQLYLPDTNVLLTRFLTHDGVAEITDFMPVDTVHVGKELVRVVSCVRGALTFNMECRPRFHYAQTKHSVQRINEKEIIFKSGGQHETMLRLRSTIPMEVDDGDLTATFHLKINQKAVFILEYIMDGVAYPKDVEAFAKDALYDTINFWKDWASKSRYHGRWAEIVKRSALVLKLMTSQKHGSIIASPTFSLPEDVGGKRNWDYRYTWIRDASFTVYTFLKLGYKKEAREFMMWVEKQCEGIKNKGKLHLMYGIDGREDLEEVELEHMEGYKGSKPVRIGNAAINQVQLDIYGELLDAAYLYDKYAEPISYKFWCSLTGLVNWLCDHWHDEDEGIWEVRGGKKQFLYSRMMCWVAMERCIRIAEAHSYPRNKRWRMERDKVFKSIHTDFWNEKLQSFVQYRGADTVDAATLLMPLIRFISPTDPRWLSTLKRIEHELVSDSLIYRYRTNQNLDGLSGGEGTFSMCTFWFVECLSKAGQLNKARLYFEKMLGYANHLGLYSEQLGKQGEHLGNFPQAFTHLGLISAALNLDHQFDDLRNKGID